MNADAMGDAIAEVLHREIETLRAALRHDIATAKGEALAAAQAEIAQLRGELAAERAERRETDRTLGELRGQVAGHLASRVAHGRAARRGAA